MPTTLTFRDFSFRAQHSLDGHSASAAHPHWHTYSVRFWFSKAHDQDWLAEWLEREFARYHGANLNLFGDSSDEALAARFLEMTSDLACVRVRVTNDGQRGAEVWPSVRNDLPEPDWGTAEDWEAYRKARTR